MLYQSQHDTAESCADHARIVAALGMGDITKATRLMGEDTGDVEAALGAAPRPIRFSPCATRSRRCR